MGLKLPAVLGGQVGPRLLRIYLCMSIGAMNFGYDNNWWSGAIASDAFIAEYGKYQGPGQPRTLPSSWLSIASGTPIAGWIVGCILASYLTSNLGRKLTIVVVCGIALVGMVMQCAIPSYWGLMAGRIVNAVSMGIEANCVPMYMAELAPAAARGGLVNFYQTWLYVGAVTASATVYGSSKNLEGTQWAYMTALVVLLAPPLMLLVAIWFVPESPRWLLQKGRTADATTAMLYMRDDNSDDGSEDNEGMVAAELDLMRQAMEQEEELHRATSYMDCLKGANGRRTLVAVGVQCLQQAQGNSFTQQYLTIFLGQVGMDDPQLITVAHHCCAFAGCVAAFYLSDKLGRRLMLMGGSVLMTALIWTVSGLASWTPGGVDGTAAKGAVAAILLYGAVAAMCWGSVMWTVTVEVGTNQLRERTVAIATVSGFLTSLVITYVNPFVQNEPGNLGSKVGMVYGGVSIIALVFVFLVVPEMRGRSLEELDEMFHAGVPAWRSRSFVATGVGATISTLEGMPQDDGLVKGGAAASSAKQTAAAVVAADANDGKRGSMS